MALTPKDCAMSKPICVFENVCALINVFEIVQKIKEDARYHRQIGDFQAQELNETNKDSK